MKRNSPLHSRHSKPGQDQQKMQLRSRRLRVKSRSNTLLARLVLAAILLVALWSLLISPYSGNAQRQVVPLVTLQSAERILETVASISALGAASSLNDKQIYALRRDTPNISTYDIERKRSKEVLSFGRAAKALAIDTRGRMYLAGESEVRVIDSTGQQLGRFPVLNPSSLAVAANGDIVVSSTDSGKLLHVYDQAGSKLKSFGELKQFDSSSATQNSFLNRGKVLVGPSGAIYYVSIFAPVPTVQKFSSEGKLLLEFAIEGNAVDLQLRHAKDFLRSKRAEIVGGFHIITSAAIDPVTGHLWVGLNASSTYGRVSSASGVAYEYDSNGVKLAEYAFYLNPPLTRTGVIVDLSDLTVSAPWIYVLTSLGQVYRFNMNDKLVRHGPQERKQYSATLNSSVRGWTSTVSPILAPMPQASCPTEQPFICAANCPTGSNPVIQDCAAEIKKRLGTGDFIISNSCNIKAATPGGCSASATSCNTGTGVQVGYSVSLDCNAAPTPTPTPTPLPEPTVEPTPTPTPTPDPGDVGGCDYNYDDAANCAYLGGYYNPDVCLCDADSPILIDTLGNGFTLTNAVGGVNFDLDSNGSPERLSWTAVSSDDAWLALDRNGNGSIENGQELFGNFTPQPPPPAGEERNGFLALAEYDKPEKGGNADGVIDRKDAVFASLRLWQDANHNGVSEPSELHTLSELNVDSISLDFKKAKRRDQYGNQFRYRAKITDSKGAQLGRWAWDVFLIEQ